MRQAANLWAIKERRWERIRDQHVPHDPTVAIGDSFPRQFARASRCSRFKGEACYGNDQTSRQTFYGFRLHVRLSWPGVMTQMVLAPANVHEGSVVPDLTVGTSGLL